MGTNLRRVPEIITMGSTVAQKSSSGHQVMVRANADTVTVTAKVSLVSGFSRCTGESSVACGDMSMRVTSFSA